MSHTPDGLIHRLQQVLQGLNDSGDLHGYEAVTEAIRAIGAATLLKHYCWTSAPEVPTWAKTHPDYPANYIRPSGFANQKDLWDRIPSEL